MTALCRTGLVILVLLLTPLSLARTATLASGIDGVWNVQSISDKSKGNLRRLLRSFSPQAGLMIVTKRHYSIVALTASRHQPPNVALATADELRQWWSVVMAQGGVYSEHSGVAEWRPAISMYPRLMEKGVSLPFAYSQQNETLRFSHNRLDLVFSRAPRYRATDVLSGVWRLISDETTEIGLPKQQGLYVFSGGYFTVIRQNNRRPGVSDIDNATAPEIRAIWGVMNAMAGRYELLQGNRILLRPAVSKDSSAPAPREVRYEIRGTELTLNSAGVLSRFEKLE